MVGLISFSTLLLLNSVANEALPLFLDKLVPPWAAILLSVTAVQRDIRATGVDQPLQTVYTPSSPSRSRRGDRVAGCVSLGVAVARVSGGCIMYHRSPILVTKTT